MPESHSDPVDRLFERLRGQPPPVPFAPAEAVRRRGRQRTFHQAIAAGVAVLVVTGLGTGSVAAALRDPEPAPPPAAPPTLAESTVTGPLLTADDLAGSGWRHDPGELVEGPWYWDGASWCPEYQVEDYASISERTELEITGWARARERVDQLVELFTPGAAARNVADVRAYLDLCSRRASPDGSVAGTVYEIADTGFAGDRSLLIRVDEYQFDEADRITLAPTPHQVVVIQVGDAVTTIRFTGHDDAYAVAERAATRLAR